MSYYAPKSELRKNLSIQHLGLYKKFVINQRYLLTKLCTTTVFNNNFYFFKIKI